MINFEEYKKTGYQIVRGLFNESEIDQVRIEAQDIFKKQMNQLGIETPNSDSEEEFNKKFNICQIIGKFALLSLAASCPQTPFF